MKNVVLSILMVIIYNFGFSQTDKIEKKLKFGFNIGAKYSNLYVKDKLPNNAKLINGIGFSFGPIAEYSFTKNIALQSNLELAYNNSRLNYTYNNTSVNYNILNTSLDFMLHFIYKFDAKKIKPYIFVGPDYKYPIAKISSDLFYKADFAIDFGIGSDKKFNKFILAPELRYSFGFSNVNITPVTPPIYFQSITFAFNFK